MKRRHLIVLSVALLAVGVAGCSGDAGEVDAGGVILSITDFDGLPVSASVTGSAGFLQVEEVTIENIAKQPDGVTSDLMNVELQSYEITFTRGDLGTRVPTPLVRGLFGVVPVNGTFTVEGLPIMSAEQLEEQPLTDLATVGFDTETGAETILLNFHMRFFGRTLSGDAVSTAPANFTIEFTS